MLYVPEDGITPCQYYDVGNHLFQGDGALPNRARAYEAETFFF